MLPKTLILLLISLKSHSVGVDGALLIAKKLADGATAKLAVVDSLEKALENDFNDPEMIELAVMHSKELAKINGELESYS